MTDFFLYTVTSIKLIPLHFFFCSYRVLNSDGVDFCLPTRGVFRGGIVPWPPLWVVIIVKLHGKESKNEACPPPLCKLGMRFDHTKGMCYGFLLGFGRQIGLFFCSSPKFGRKIGLNLSEDLFGRKIGLNLNGTISDSDLCSSQTF